MTELQKMKEEVKRARQDMKIAEASYWKAIEACRVHNGSLNKSHKATMAEALQKATNHFFKVQDQLIEMID